MIPNKEFFKRDKFAEYIGINIDEFAKGYAKVNLKIDKIHLNGIGIIHGGVIFSLADYALAIASNSHGKVAVSLNANITYIKSSNGGVITATAKEISKGTKVAIYQVEITNEKNNKLAIFQGTVYITGKEIIL